MTVIEIDHLVIQGHLFLSNSALPFAVVGIGTEVDLGYRR
jgi:hypothetical protein